MSFESLSCPLVPPDFTPTTALSITYDGKAVEAGNLFRANECKTAPFVSFDPEPDAPSDACYTLMLVDADAPTPEDPKFAFWRHWVLPGLQPLRGAHGVVGQTKPALTEYLGPCPTDEAVDDTQSRSMTSPTCSMTLTDEYKSLMLADEHRSKPHRYLFLLYREPPALALSKDDIGGDEFSQRRSFDVRAFVAEKQLRLVGVNWMHGIGDERKA